MLDLIDWALAEGYEVRTISKATDNEDEKHAVFVWKGTTCWSGTNRNKPAAVAEAIGRATGLEG